MQRRSFITLLGGAVAAPAVGWPRPMRGQQLAMPVVGFIFPGMPGLEAASFRMGLGEQGFVEGRNLAIEARYARNDYRRLPELAADLVARKVAVIAAVGGSGAPQAAQAATKTIPIVFQYAADPVEDGLVASFNRPGGNITGFTSMNREIDGKRLGLLHELAPKAVRIGLLGFDAPNAETRIRNAVTAAAALGQQIEHLSAATSGEIDDAFASLAQKQIDAVLVQTNPILIGFRSHLATAAARAGVPVMYMERPFVEAGGLMSYGPDLQDIFRLVGVYVGRILKGEKPADLPVVRPTKFEFIINLQTARLLRIDIPPTLLALADQVIE